MTEKLKRLKEINKSVDKLVQEINHMTSEMKAEYENRKMENLKEFIEEVRILADYSKDITGHFAIRKGMYANLDISLPFPSSFGNSTVITFETDGEGNFKFTTLPLGYSQRMTIYSSLENEWQWNRKECQEFFSENSQRLIDNIREAIEKSYEQSMRNKLAKLKNDYTEIEQKMENLTGNADKSEKNKDRLIKIYNDMEGEYEIIQTDAPDEVISKCLERLNNQMENMETIENDVYTYIEVQGYYVNMLGCSDDAPFIQNEYGFDAEFNIADYNGENEDPVVSFEKTLKWFEQKRDKVNKHIGQNKHKSNDIQK